MALFETVLKSDLKRPVTVQQLTGNLFSADNGGNKITVEVTDNGSAATLSGGVTGYIIREDNATVTVIGSLSGNRASIVLPSSAYNVVGKVSIVVKVGTTTVGACTSYVYRTTTDTLVDPGHVIPSIEELLAKIAACEQATSDANNAATNANTKANLADQKATLADQKATAANNAATAANSAATKIDDMTVAISAGDPTQNPTATLTLVNGHYVLTFNNMKGNKGDTGDAFHVVKTYASISAMNADYSGTDVKIGEYVMIVSDVEDPDNAKVYIKGSSAYSFVVDMSGSAGIQGQQAYVWIKYASVEPAQDSDMKTTPDDWIGIYSGTASTAPTTYTSYTWFEFKGDKGDKGDTGNTGATGADGTSAYVHIKWAANEPTQDSDMKSTADAWMGIYSGTSSSAPTTYTSYTWYKVKGETGATPTVYGNTIEMSSSDTMKVSEAIAEKLDANQGSENAGKALGIANDGSVIPVPFSGEDFTGATALTDGVHGYVPAPEAGEENKFLKGDGTWGNVPDPQTMSGATSSAAGTGGLVPTPTAGSNVLFLRGDATWANPPGSKLIVKELDNVSNTSGSYSHTTTLSDVAADMKAVMIELGDPSVFLDTINVTTADGSITLTCNSVEGTSTVRVGLLFVATSGAITSSEFDVLAARIGTLSSLHTTAKTSLVDATNEIADQITTLSNKIGKIITSGSLHDIKTPGIYWLSSSVTDKPEAGAGLYIISKYNNNYLAGIYNSADNDHAYSVRYGSNTWQYERLAQKKTYNVTGTTSSTGAISIDSAYRDYTFVGGYLTTGDPGFVVRRDISYFTVFNNQGSPMANTSVAFTAVFIV